jgi:hypothetical protein
VLTVGFDTLKLARRLESAGFPAKQAQDASAALAETFTEWQGSINLATREDVQKAEQRLEARISETAQKLELRIAEKAAETVKWALGISVAQAGLIIAILRIHN